jgi:hypothetical protein
MPWRSLYILSITWPHLPHPSTRTHRHLSLHVLPYGESVGPSLTVMHYRSTAAPMKEAIRGARRKMGILVVGEPASADQDSPQ